MSFVLKIAVIASAGLLSFALFYYIFIALFAKISGSGAAAAIKTETKPEAKEKKEDALKKAIKVLSEDPSSKQSLKIKFTFSAVPFIVVLALTTNIMFSLLAAAGMFFGLGAYFEKQIKDKMGVFNDQLIEALGMITNSVRAGQSFTQALENLVKDSKPPLSTEFELVLKKIKLGTPVGDALIEMSDKVKSNDLRISVLSINLARESGGNMGEILSRIAETMRERKKIHGKIAALTAQGKASGIVMGCVPFILLAVLYFIQPSMMGLLFTTFLGNVMLCVVVIMITVGMVVINKIVSIDI
jgi:tight adherence protein B